MQSMGIGAGLAAMAFWGFVAAVVVAGIWYSVREREAKHETLRRMLESNQPLDQALMDQLFTMTGGGHRNLERELKVYGLVVLFLSPGLALLGWFVSLLAPAALYPILGAAALLLCLASGLLVASSAVGRMAGENDPRPAPRP